MARLTHFHVLAPLQATGLEGRALADAVAAVTGRLVPLAPHILELLTERLLREATRDNVAARVVGDVSQYGELTVAIMFVDLCGFTPLADAMGDRESAAVLGRFSALVREALGSHHGRLVKQIGDAFMLVFADAAAAVACAVDIDRRAAAEPRFPAVRSGVQWGPVLFRDGDYVGGNVNIAARVADEAGRHEVLVTNAVRRAAGDVPGVAFLPRGARRLKGLSEELELFAAETRTAPAAARVVDPVCGMEIGAAEAVARLALVGRELVFCSTGCLQRYVADPGRYA